MPGGQYDSSKTRVSPVFDALERRTDDWVRNLLLLARHPGVAPGVLEGLDLHFSVGYWGESERGLAPPLTLLEWLVRNVDPARIGPEESPERQRLAARDAATIDEALDSLRAGPRGKKWYVLEGPTYPDALIETRDAIIVVEGKRTEAGPTTYTKFLDGRHQIWRHIDAAWEQRDGRQVFGMFVVEGAGDGDSALPAVWREACDATLHAETLCRSFPHRTAEERDAIARCFVGATTWQRLCEAFDLPASTLLRAVG